MNLEIKNIVNNPVIERDEITFEIKDAKSLRRDEVKKQLAQARNVSENLISILYIKRVFGTRSCFGKAHIYKSPETLKKFEQKHLLIRGTKSGEKKAKKEVEKVENK
ncbi:MAG: hypothetical protein QXM75_04235 [Candidatus Diapherotrites archaeon]